MNQAALTIPYIPPKADAKEYAASALRHLKTLERFDPRLLAYMLAPSNVLALAGLRSFSPYNDTIRFDLNMMKLDKLLASYGFLWLNENPIKANLELPSYALVNFEVADHLGEMYPLGVITTLGAVPERSVWAFFAWQAGFDIALARTMESNVLPSEWLKDWWSPHDVRFGTLLGYPGAAIESLIESEITRKPAELLTVSTGLFNGADVSFFINKDYMQRDDVVGVVATWRATLAAVYAVYTEETLMADAEFAAVVRTKV